MYIIRNNLYSAKKAEEQYVFKNRGNSDPTKGKPVVKRGRKAMGPVLKDRQATEERIFLLRISGSPLGKGEIK
jgi:hypothetical protein